MSLQATLDQITGNRWATLRLGAQRGDYTLPDDFTRPYDAIQRLADAAPPTVAPDAGETVEEAARKLVAAALAGKPVPVGVGALSASRASAQDVADWRLARDVAVGALFGQLVAAISGQGARILADHLQPAYVAKLKEFAQDVVTIGPFAGLIEPTIAVVGAPDEVREAFLRWYGMHAWYAPIRAAWRILRAHDTGACTDPNGVGSLLGEIANAPDIAPDHWQLPVDPDRGHTIGPWPVHTPHVRAAWILTNGGHLWCPTAAEQNAAYKPYTPDPTPYYLRGGNVDRSPYAAIRRAAGNLPTAA